MLMAELVIYLVAVPLGVVCGVYRGEPLDRGHLAGAVLASIRFRRFVAGMLFLLFLCYGDYLKIFPMTAAFRGGRES